MGVLNYASALDGKRSQSPTDSSHDEEAVKNNDIRAQDEPDAAVCTDQQHETYAIQASFIPRRRRTKMPGSWPDTEHREPDEEELEMKRRWKEGIRREQEFYG